MKTSNSIDDTILEIATLNIINGKATEFEEAFKLAVPIISSMPGYIKHELQQCIENKHQYVLFVWWTTLEAHTIEFRESAEYRIWKNLLHKFYEPFPIVLHYQKLN